MLSIATKSQKAAAIAATVAAGVWFLGMGGQQSASQSTDSSSKMEAAKGIFRLAATKVDGSPFLLSQLSGKVGLVTNVASFWGKTNKHYAQMKTLHSEYAGQGLEIVAVPSTQFNQEYKTNDELANYIREKEIAFTVLGLADVNGAKAHPLYALLKEATGSGDITWNFGSYFLLDRAGGVQRFDGKSPQDLTDEIEAKLAEDTPSL